MTVCVSVKVHDCLIFAADSASSLAGADPAGNPVVHNVWSHGNKVFNLYKGRPIAAMTCGMGHMGPASIGNLAKDFRRMITKGIGGEAINPDAYTIEEVASAHETFSLPVMTPFNLRLLCRMGSSFGLAGTEQAVTMLRSGRSH